jgi:hypothetical protein
MLGAFTTVLIHTPDEHVGLCSHRRQSAVAVAPTPLPCGSELCGGLDGGSSVESRCHAMGELGFEIFPSLLKSAAEFDGRVSDRIPRRCSDRRR